MAATDIGLGRTWNASVTAGGSYLHFLTTDFYSTFVNDAKNNSATLLSLIPSTSRFISGKFVVEPVKFGRNHQAFNNVNEGGKFPDPGDTKARVYTYRSRTQFVRMIIDGFLMRAAQKDETRYVDPIVDMMADFMDDYMPDTARKLYSDGSGRLAEVMTTALPAATQGDITLRVNQDIATGIQATGASAAGANDWAPTLYLEPGMRVAIFNPSGGTFKCTATVDSITSATQATMSVILDSAGVQNNWNALTNAIADGDWMVKISNDDSTSVNTNKTSSAWRCEPMGLGGIFGEKGVFDGNGPAVEAGSTSAQISEGSTAYTFSGTDNSSTTNPNFFQGVPANSSAAGWIGEMIFNQGIVLHASGAKRSPTEQLLQRAYSTIRKANNAKINMILSSYEVRDTYAEGLLGEKRYNDTIDLKGGWDPALKGPAGVPWAVDRLCQGNRAYLLALEDGGFMQHVLEPLSWASEQGAPVWTYLQDDDKYQGRMVESYNIGVGVRNRCGGVVLDLLHS